jgi:FdhD protein
MALPFLTQARAPLTREIETVNEHGDRGVISIPAERPLTVYVDRRELVTLMTLGARPEWLVLGYLRNQRLVRSVGEIESITVDWEVGAAAVKTRSGIKRLKERTARRVVTTGCGQGSVFGGLMDEIESIHLAPAAMTQAQLYGILNAIRLQESTYKSAGSVHGCALFRGDEMLLFVEDVGRHNAIDTIAGWMWMQDENGSPDETSSADRPPLGASAPLGGSAAALAASVGADISADRPPLAASVGADMNADRPPLVFYTTGRLTSEMIIKSAQMGVPIVISRSGITQMGHEIAQRLDLCAIGRATNKHFLCYCAAHRLQLQPELAGPKLRAVA